MSCPRTLPKDQNVFTKRLVFQLATTLLCGNPCRAVGQRSITARPVYRINPRCKLCPLSSLIKPSVFREPRPTKLGLTSRASGHSPVAHTGLAKVKFVRNG